MSGTGEKMIREEEIVVAEVHNCSAEQHAKLVEEIRIRLERIRDAKSCESSCDKDRYFPLVRMDR